MYVQTRRVSGTDTRTTVLDGLVRARELSEVVADHLGLDLHRVEDLHSPVNIRPAFYHAQSEKATHLAVVDADDGTNHLGDDDHVTEVGLYDRGLLVGGRLLLGLAELLDEAHRLALETALEPAAGTGVNELAGARFL